MSAKSALNEVVHVLDDIKKDPDHAVDHERELQQAVEHLEAEHVEIPASLSALQEDLRHEREKQEAREAEADAFFDNMPV